MNGLLLISNSIALRFVALGIASALLSTMGENTAGYVGDIITLGGVLDGRRGSGGVRDR